MNRASLNQEGKIHLGFVYARDESMVTARTMIEHALRFAPALESLIGTTIDWEPHLSERFHCGIHRDSSLTMDEHLAHFNTLERIYQEASDDRRMVDGPGALVDAGSATVLTPRDGRCSLL